MDLSAETNLSCCGESWRKRKDHRLQSRFISLAVQAMAGGEES